MKSAEQAPRSRSTQRRVAPEARWPVWGICEGVGECGTWLICGLTSIREKSLRQSTKRILVGFHSHAIYVGTQLRQKFSRFGSLGTQRDESQFQGRFARLPDRRGTRTMEMIASNLRVLLAQPAKALRWRKFRSAQCLSFILTTICTASYPADLVLNNVRAKVYFSPNGGCAQAIIDEINKASVEIPVQAYHDLMPMRVQTSETSSRVLGDSRAHCPEGLASSVAKEYPGLPCHQVTHLKAHWYHIR
jgi:hypothetical protein